MPWSVDRLAEERHISRKTIPPTMVKSISARTTSAIIKGPWLELPLSPDEPFPDPTLVFVVLLVAVADGTAVGEAAVVADGDGVGDGDGAGVGEGVGATVTAVIVRCFTPVV